MWSVKIPHCGMKSFHTDKTRSGYWFPVKKARNKIFQPSPANVFGLNPAISIGMQIYQTWWMSLVW